MGRLSAPALASADLRDAAADAARRLMTAAVEAGARARVVGRPVLAHVVARTPSLDPVAVFDGMRSTAAERFLWLQPAARFALVGIGSAWETAVRGPSRFTAIESARRWAQDHAAGDFPASAPWGKGPVSQYGFSFAAGPVSREWRDFPNGRLTVPRVLIAQSGGAGWLAASAMVPPDAEAATDAVDQTGRCLDALTETGALVSPGPDGAFESLEALEEHPAAQVWRDMIEDAARAVRRGRLAKVVLARSLRVRAARVDLGRALRTLAAGYGESTVFAVARKDACFLGATPEQLVCVRGGAFHTAAVAGSAPRGTTARGDRRLGERLLRSRKDLAEHAAVVDAVRVSLAGVSANAVVGAHPGLLSTRSVHHLYTSISGRLAGPYSVLDLVARLHPTPAVGGVPRGAALRWIREREGLDRGWYAGPVGWTNGAGEGEAVVAIRSALVRDHDALLFAGCGIMGDSEPAAEFQESTWKLRPMLSALGGR